MRTSPPRSHSRWMAGALGFAAAWWVFDLLVLRAGVPDRLDDTWEYGVVARSLLSGAGFRTGVIHPPLWGLRDADFTVPVLVHGPLVPALLAPFLALFGPGALDHTAWLAAAGALAAVPALVRLGRRCGNDAVGFAAALLWTVAPLTLRSVHHDVSLTLGAALLLAGLERATRPAPEGPQPFAAGVAIGLAALARHEMLAAVPLVALALGRSGWRFLPGALACLVPWWVHHAMAVGQPLFNLSSYLLVGYWGSRPGLSVLRDFALTPERFPSVLRESLPEIAAKAWSFAPHAVKRALLAPFGSVGWLAPLGAAFALARPGTRRAALLLVALAAVPVAVMTLTLYDDRYLVPCLPIFALAAARGAHDLAQRMPWWLHRPRAWIGLLVLAALPVSLPALREESASARRAATVLAAERRALAAWDRELGGRGREGSGTGPAFVISDTPDFVAWTTGRPVLWLPAGAPRIPSTAPGAAPAPAWFHPGDPDVSR